MELVIVALVVSAVILAAILVTYRLLQNRSARSIELSSYLSSLADLLKNQDDASVSALLESLPLTHQTLELHLAFGDFLRKRGEVDKSVAIHTNVVNAKLSDHSVRQATLALALDYKQAGLLDRAEVLLEELILKINATNVNAETKLLLLHGLEALTDLYQEEGEWVKAITCCDQVRAHADTSKAKLFAFRQAHYCCEQSLVAKTDQQAKARWIEKAKLCDPAHVRATVAQLLLSCRSESKESEQRIFEGWLKVFSRLPQVWRDIDTAKLSQGEQLLILKAAHQAFKDGGSSQLFEPAVMYVRQTADEQAVQSFVSSYLSRLVPQPAVSSFLTDIGRLDIDARQQYHLTQAVLALVSRPLTCAHCGFEAEDFFWCCPTCKAWR